MCLEAEGEDGNADEEHGDNPNHLQAYFTQMYDSEKLLSSLQLPRIEVHSFFAVVLIGFNITLPSSRIIQRRYIVYFV
jgi:hypothetical protein